MSNVTGGPFGNYEPRTVGGLLNALVNYYGVPLHRAEIVQIGNGEIIYAEKVVGVYRWFDGLNTPMVRFQGDEFNHYNERLQGRDMTLLDDGRIRPNFKLSLSIHDTVGLIIEGRLATPELHDHVRYVMLTNWMDQPSYSLSKESGAFFQGGSENREGEWIYVEFHNPSGAQAWVDYLNETFTYSTDPYGV